MLGMFRNNANDLATDLAFFEQVFRQGGRVVDRMLSKPIRAGADGSDAVVIAHTVNEFRRGFMGQPAAPRLPCRLRQELERRRGFCFNPLEAKQAREWRVS